jgi:hypothetical protein
MKLSAAIFATLALPATLAFQPIARSVPSRIQSPTQLFLADQIKDYKKGLSKISGAESNKKVGEFLPFHVPFLSPSITSCRLLFFKLFLEGRNKLCFQVWW